MVSTQANAGRQFTTDHPGNGGKILENQYCAYINGGECEANYYENIRY